MRIANNETEGNRVKDFDDSESSKQYFITMS